jgi:hypothetical protein
MLRTEEEEAAGSGHPHLIFVDAGLVVRLSEADKRNFSDLFVAVVRRAFSSWTRSISILAEICLCHACSGHENRGWKRCTGRRRGRGSARAN